MAAGSPYMRYELELRRNVPNYGFFGVAAILLLIPPVLATFRKTRFEAARWRESDYPLVRPRGGDD